MKTIKRTAQITRIRFRLDLPSVGGVASGKLFGVVVRVSRSVAGVSSTIEFSTATVFISDWKNSTLIIGYFGQNTFAL
jgi:hypothetical protein